MCDKIEKTIPEIIHENAELTQVAAVFDSENVSFTFSNIYNETEMLAAGLISTGLKEDDRILICGSNNSQLFISTLACSRAGLIFSLISPNITAAQLRYFLEKGAFRAIICFPASKETELVHTMLIEIAPELRRCTKGRLSSPALPKLTHVIMGIEEHKHAGTYTLSEIFGRSSRERIEKLPDYAQWSTHRVAALQFTSGTSNSPKLVAISHFQILNGCRTVSLEASLKSAEAVCCALPMFRLPIFGLVALSPFISKSKVIFPSPSPLPKFLFSSITKHNCVHLLTNAIALRLVLKVANSQKIQMNSITNVILVGERVTSDLLKSISSEMPSVKTILSGFMLTEVASLPILANDKGDIVKSIGKPIDGFKIKVENIGASLPSTKVKLGELYIQPYEGSKFLGYDPDFKESEWICTGDIVAVDSNSNIELITQKDDLICDRFGNVIEHWSIEKAILAHSDVKGAQVVVTQKGGPLIVLIVLKNMDADLAMLKTDIISICKNNKLSVPEKFGVMSDYPRLNSRIQKYRIREMIRNGEINLE